MQPIGDDRPDITPKLREMENFIESIEGGKVYLFGLILQEDRTGLIFDYAGDPQEMVDLLNLMGKLCLHTARLQESEDAETRQ